MFEQYTTERLCRLLEIAPKRQITNETKLVIFSDLHIGNRGKRDDFRKNSELFKQIIEDYYLKDSYLLILNGDIEELQRFNLNSIRKKWADLYSLLDVFYREERLIKTVGNHDLELLTLPRRGIDGNLLESIGLVYGGKSVFVFHGHQASVYYEKYNFIPRIFLRYVANPLGIQNYSISRSNQKRYRIEKRVYRFAAREKTLSIIGHTHRPLFESLSKVDTIKFRIEDLLRQYKTASAVEREAIRASLKEQTQTLRQICSAKTQFSLSSSVYSEDIIIPVLFNSGCGIGKRGITCIEICGGAISLIHWFDIAKSRRYSRDGDYFPEQLDGSDYFKLTLRSAPLEDIFNRIELLS